MKRILGKIFSAPSWSLNNPLKGWTLHGLSEREARLLLHTASLAEKRVISVWRTGWTKWLPLDDGECAFLQRSYRTENADAPTVLKFTPEEDITSVQAPPRYVRSTGEREYERIPTEVPAEIVQGPQSFRTKTADVSEGGIRFADCLPEWVAGYFTVILGLGGGPIEITCMLVEDQKKEKTRVEIVETEDEESHLPVYRDWIKEIRDARPS